MRMIVRILSGETHDTRLFVRIDSSMLFHRPHETPLDIAIERIARSGIINPYNESQSPKDIADKLAHAIRQPFIHNLCCGLDGAILASIAPTGLDIGTLPTLTIDLDGHCATLPDGSAIDIDALSQIDSSRRRLTSPDGLMKRDRYQATPDKETDPGILQMIAWLMGVHDGLKNSPAEIAAASTAMARGTFRGTVMPHPEASGPFMPGAAAVELAGALRADRGFLPQAPRHYRSALAYGQYLAQEAYVILLSQGIVSADRAVAPRRHVDGPRHAEAAARLAALGHDSHRAAGRRVAGMLVSASSEAWNRVFHAILTERGDDPIQYSLNRTMPAESAHEILAEQRLARALEEALVTAEHAEPSAPVRASQSTAPAITHAEHP